MMFDGAVDSDRWFGALRWLLDVKQGRVPLEVPILDDGCEQIGTLTPISVRHLADAELLERFVRWRNQNRSGYLDQRPVTLEGVRRYVEDVVYNPTRLTFLAYCDGQPIGRLGAVGIGPREHESDGLVRGERGGGMRFMHWAQITSMVLIFHVLNQQRITSRVLSGNELARDSCRSLGYDMNPISSQPVYRRKHIDGVTLETTGTQEELITDVTLDTFRLERHQFLGLMRRRDGFTEIESVVKRYFPFPGIDE